MNVSLTPELNNTSRRGFQAGYYSASEVIREDCACLEAGASIRLQELRQDIQAGLAEPTP